MKNNCFSEWLTLLSFTFCSSVWILAVMPTNGNQHKRLIANDLSECARSTLVNIWKACRQIQLYRLGFQNRWRELNLFWSLNFFFSFDWNSILTEIVFSLITRIEIFLNFIFLFRNLWTELLWNCFSIIDIIRKRGKHFRKGRKIVFEMLCYLKNSKNAKLVIHYSAINITFCLK